jgi:CRISPR-associated protein Cas2
MLRIIVLYDMSKDRPRLKVADTCLDYGLDRLQYSVFSGRLRANQIKALAKELQRYEKEGSILIMPIAANQWDDRIELGAPLHE